MVFRNPFRKRPLTELCSEAATLFDAGSYGDAKLAYDRIAERARSEDPRVHAEAEARVVACCDKLALDRATYARELARVGETDLAREELSHALQTARSEALIAQLRALELALADKPEAAPEQTAAPLGDEERLMLITASWEPLQAAELESYGEPLLDALLALDRDAADEGLARLEAIRASAKEPRYLWLELARAQLGRKDEAAAATALRTFLGRIAPDEGGSARLGAHRELARMAHDRGDREAAVAELEAAAEALSDDPRPYLELGGYLRIVGRPRDAIEVLLMCEGLFGERKVEWPVVMELGLAYAEAGDTARATVLLEQVLQELLAKGERDLPPAAAVTLARLHEAQGNPTRAADLYRTLTLGSDTANQAHYHGEAARLLDVLKLTDEAERMRQKARALGSGG